MPVYDQGYRHWDGPLGGALSRVATITATELRRSLRNKLVVGVLLASMIPCVALSFVAMVGQSDIRLFSTLVSSQVFFVALVCAFVGGGLIANDREQRAFELYSARPVRRFDYVAGKLGAILALNLAVTLVPFSVLYLVEAFTQSSFEYVRENLRIPLALGATAVVLSAVSSVLVLAVSSLVARPRVAAVLWLAFHFGGFSIAKVLYRALSDTQLSWISHWANHASIARALLDVKLRDEADFAWTRAAIALAALTAVALVVIALRTRELRGVRG